MPDSLTPARSLCRLTPKPEQGTLASANSSPKAVGVYAGDYDAAAITDCRVNLSQWISNGTQDDTFGAHGRPISICLQNAFRDQTEEDRR
jgi:hypothetical protein